MATAVPTGIENAALAKLTYGATTADRASFRKLGLDGWLADQLNPKKSESAAVAANLAKFSALNMDQPEIQKTFPYSVNGGLVAEELAHATLYRRLNSSLQLYETLVEFMQDYVPVPLYSDPVKRLSYDRDAIRPNVLKTYPDLLWATAQHPAMLQFLSGYANTKQHPNENFGRELLELFTVTTATPYTQDDVVNAARVFSGISWRDDTFETTVWVDNHWTGTVKVLDWTDSNTGQSPAQVFATAKSLVTHLALMPETAKAFATRMARRYVADVPSAAIVSAMQATYLSTKGSIPEVVKTMVKHPDFVASTGKKLKRPVEFMLSTMRTLGVQLDGRIQFGDVTFSDYFKGSNLQTFFWSTIQQGHSPFNWPTPDGYPDTEASWTTMSAQVLRWKRAAEIAGYADAYTVADYAKLFKGVKNDWNAIADASATLLFGRKLPAAQRATVIAAAKKSDVAFANNPFLAKCKAVTLLLCCTEDWNRR
jgi:uncharacterized protein (DUF1800 family)